MVDKIELKIALRKATNCTAQHDGWPCGTCFYSISQDLDNSDWQAVLLFRGDYRREELDNLPEDMEATLEKVYRIALGYAAQHKGDSEE